MDEQDERGRCQEPLAAQEGPAPSSCPVFPVENGAILVGFGIFIVLLPVVPVVIGIPSVLPIFIGVPIAVFGVALVWKGIRV